MLRTIVTQDPSMQEVIGEAKGLSFNDIKLANLIYKCESNYYFLFPFSYKSKI